MQMNIALVSIVFLVMLSVVSGGCASVPQKRGNGPKSAETADQQMDAARKVLGGLGGREVSEDQLKQMVRDMEKNGDTRAVVSKITGTPLPGSPPVVKYSPITGKHYSGDLDIDPETGVQLEVLPE